MTTVRRWTQTFLMTGTITLFTTVASPQSAHHGGGTVPRDDIQNEAGQTSSGDQSPEAMLKLGLTRITTVDADIKALVADMNMFTGETQIATMARVLTLLVERQSMMREQMMAMHEGMMRTMMGPISGATYDEAPSEGTTRDDVEPGTMCVERPF